MRAAVARQGQLICEEIDELTPQAGQVLVKTLCCGICGSDLHALHHLDDMAAAAKRTGGGLAGFDPSKGMVFGHEFCAEVLDYAPGDAHRLKAGTRVVTVPVLFGAEGVASIGYSNTYPGGFAERMLLSDALLLPVPNGLSDRQAAMTEPFAVGAHAVARAAIDQDSAALVVGCGPVGLAVIASLKAKGYGPVAAADFSPARRAMAERMGADIVIDPAKESPHTKWSDMGVPASGAEQMMVRMMGKTPKRAIVFECVGSPGVLQSLIEAAPGGSQIIVAGVHAWSPTRSGPLHGHHQTARFPLRARLHARGIRPHPRRHRRRPDRCRAGDHRRGGPGGRCGGLQGAGRSRKPRSRSWSSPGVRPSTAHPFTSHRITGPVFRVP